MNLIRDSLVADLIGALIIFGFFLGLCWIVFSKGRDE